MITILEYALLSGHVYQPNVTTYFGTKIKSRPISQLSKITDSHWYQITDIDPNMHPYHSYYAALYVKFQDGRPTDAVVSIRGTVTSMLGDDVEDFFGWWADALSNGEYDRIPSYVHLIWAFVIECITIAHHLSVKLNLTGHSLGGAIAQIICLTIHIFETITFNAPGCGHMPRVYKDRSGAIHNINSRYGFINKVGLVMGEIDYIDVPNMEAEAKQIFTRYKEVVAKQGHHAGTSTLGNSKIRIEDYYDAYEALASDVAGKVGADCQPSQHESMIRRALSDIGAYACREYAGAKAQGSLLVDVIKAQHSIIHVVETLKRAEYSGLAHRVIF